ncbi:MAG: hypothetical protein KatS3mg087_1304 [Patescibacteria group bacterium]|nr:MAG: hypothetical protein KatS3mg087_1304 [Patescibacteria group bacterium]
MSLTQAEYDKLAKRAFYILGKVWAVEELRSRFAFDKHRIVEEGDAGNTSNWEVVSGLDIGVNTSIEGVLYIRITGTTGNWTIAAYKAAGGSAGDKVAEATGVAENTTVTLSPVNNSGLTLKTTLAGSVTADTSDRHVLRAYTDYPKRDEQVFNGDESRDKLVKDRIVGTNVRVAQLLESVRNVLLADFERMLIEYLRLKDNISTSTSAIIHNNTRDTSGTVSTAVQGILEDLRAHMAVNSPVQTVVKGEVSAGTPVFNPNNTGKGTMSAPTLLEHAKPGVIHLSCVSETIGREEFLVSHIDNETNESTFGQNRLRVKQTYRDSQIGIASMILNRTLTKTGDSSNLNFAAASSATVSGEASTNTDDGILHFKITANGSNWNIKVYKSSNMVSANEVAEATNIATGASFTTTELNGSGISISWAVGSGPTDGSTATLNLNTFRTGPPADRIDITISRTSIGTIQKAIAELYNWYLNSAAAGSETLKDALLTAGNTFLEGRNG